MGFDVENGGWRMAAGRWRKSEKARLVAKGNQDPDLQDGLVDTSGRVSLPSSRLQVVSLGAIENWKLWNLDIKNALRDVSMQAPAEWEQLRSDRIWKLHASAYSLNDAPLELHRSLAQHTLSSEATTKRVGFQSQVTNFGPRLFSIFRDTGSPAGSSTAHIGDIPWRGEPEVLPKIRDYLEQRSGELKLREPSSVDVGMELEQDDDFSAT